MKPLNLERQQLVLDNVKLAYYYSWKVSREYRFMPIDEFKAEAVLALTIAAAKFDATGGASFVGYAGMLIRHALWNAVRRWHRWHKRPLAWMEAGRLWDREGLRTEEPLADVHDEIAKVRKAVQARWFNMMSAHYADGQTLNEIGTAHGVTPQRVRQINEVALRRARKVLA